MYRLENRKRFAQRVNGKGNSCWVYEGPIHPSGYGVFHAAGNTKYAHCYVMEFIFGPPAAGLETDHLCGNKACVNPFHLERVTHAENIRRAAQIHINRHGKFWNTKLDIEDVLMIREMYKRGIPVREIAKRIDYIRIRNIYAVVRGESWKHLK